MNAGNYTYDDGGVYVANLANKGEKYGIAQYRYPHNYELAGKTVVITADGADYTLDFECRCHMKLNGEGFEYEALKTAPKMYYVLFGFNSAVVDFTTGAAALIKEGQIICGTIKDFEGAVAAAPAGDEMVETYVDWVFGVDRYMTQEFTSADRMNVCWSPKTDAITENAYRAVKISSSFYLVDMKSDVLKDTCAPFFTDHVVLLQDYDRCMAYGAVFGKGFDPMLVTAYARFH